MPCEKSISGMWVRVPVNNAFFCQQNAIERVILQKANSPNWRPTIWKRGKLATNLGKTGRLATNYGLIMTLVQNIWSFFEQPQSKVAEIKKLCSDKPLNKGEKDNVV